MAERRRLYWGLAALAAVAAVLILFVLLHRQPAKPAPPHAIPVTTALASRQTLQLSVTALGAAQAWTSDTIFAQVSGKLIRVNFVEGGEVRAGQLLAEVDPAPYKAALMQAEGALTRDRGVLAGARRDLERYQKLVSQDSIARQTAEDEAATVAQDEGAVEIDEGAVAAAKINLAYCRIVSPISGRAGVRLVDPGNIVSASGSVASTPATASATSTAPASGGSSGSAGGGTTGASGGTSGSGIVVINQIEPIAVTFTVPEGQLQRLIAVSDGFRKSLAVQAFSQESGELLGAGELRIADNRVDPSTGTVELKARFANADQHLWPGQFVNVRLGLQVLAGATTVPTSAVNRGPNGQYVFVVGADNHVQMRVVTLAGTQDKVAIIQAGVGPGERVVTDGQMTLKAGSLVRVAKTVQAGAAGP